MKPFTLLAAALFLALAVAHACRMLFAIPVTIADSSIPLWPSAVALVVSLALSLMLWREARR
jgi:hypothetical protein